MASAPHPAGPPLHPLATEHLPFFITPPGQTDILFVIMVAFLIGAVLLVGNFYFHLHAIPEKLAHRASKVQMELVAVLSLIALFTHENIFWIAALLLAMIQFPDFGASLSSITKSLERMADESESRWREPRSDADEPQPAETASTEGAAAPPPAKAEADAEPAPPAPRRTAHH